MFLQNFKDKSMKKKKSNKKNIVLKIGTQWEFLI